MIRSFRVPLLGAASLVLLAAGQVPDALSTSDSAQISAAAPAPMSPVVLASYTPPAQPLLSASLPPVEDDQIFAPSLDAAPRSLRALVDEVSATDQGAMDAETRCLAVAVYYESKGESLEGQLAVAQVILNRVESGKWASSVCKVVYQRGQFSFTWDRTPDKPRDSAMWRTAQAIAVIAESGAWREIVPDATSFHATRVSPGWSNLRRVATVGNHVFYRPR
jgi:spore germination cell wall hydrolase CwlJ-like protein